MLKVEIQEGIISYNQSIEYLRSAVDTVQIEIYFMWEEVREKNELIN